MRIATFLLFLQDLFFGRLVERKTLPRELCRPIAFLVENRRQLGRVRWTYAAHLNSIMELQILVHMCQSADDKTY